MKTPKAITCQSVSEYFLTTSQFVTPIPMEKLKMKPIVLFTKGSVIS